MVETDYSAALLCLGRYIGAQPFPAPRVDLYIVGGLTEFNPKVRSRGSDLYCADERATSAAASIGLSTQTIDVAMDLRLVAATSREVLAVRALLKQIIGREIEIGVFEFRSGGVVDIAAVQCALEPVQTAARIMIDRAIFKFVGPLYNLPANVCLNGREAPIQRAPTQA